MLTNVALFMMYRIALDTGPMATHTSYSLVNVDVIDV